MLYPWPVRVNALARPVGISNWSAWGQLHPQGCQILSLDPLLFGFNYMPVNWYSRQESHLQPPRSKRSALVLELREQKGRRKIAEGRRSRIAAATPEHLMGFFNPLSSFEIEMEPTERLASGGRQKAERRMQERQNHSVGLLHSSFILRTSRNGGSPRCCPVLCGLRDRCIAAMLATQTRREGGVEPPQPGL
jgi:hypothetical protein